MSNTAPKNYKPKFYQTISWRLALAFSGLLSVVLISLLMLVAVTLRSYMINELDKSLTSSGKLLASQTVDQLITGSKTQILPSDFYFYVNLTGTGSVQVAHPTIIENYGTPATPNLLAAKADPNPRTVLGTHKDTSWRVITVNLTSKITGNSVGLVVIAHHLNSVKSTVSNVVRIMA